MALILAGCALALAQAAAAPSAVQAGTCPAADVLVDVFVIYHGPGFWSGDICVDGRFRASGLDGKHARRLAAEEMESLRELVGALPTKKAEYSFGISYV